jgi:hypothetical protein
VRPRRLSLPLSEEHMEELNKIASAEKRSMGAQAALIIEEWLIKQKKDQQRTEGQKKG